jgi:hypothetical protein
MPQVIRVRDVVRAGVHEFGPDEPALRGPYELFNPAGPVLRQGPLAEYVQGGAIHSGRIAETALGDTHPGERVLLQLPPHASAEEWWLCEVEAVNGVSGVQ